MKTPQPYIRHVTAIRFLPDGSNADAINLVFDGNCQINSDPAQFILTPYGIILPGEWMVKKTDGWHFLTDVDFQRRYKPEPSCRWKEDEDGNWDTDCKKTYAFEYRPGNDFCHNCGGRVTFEPWKESEE